MGIPIITATPAPPWAWVAEATNYNSIDVYGFITAVTSESLTASVTSGSEILAIVGFKNSGTPVIVQSLVYCSNQVGSGTPSATSPALSKPTTNGNAIIVFAFWRTATSFTPSTFAYRISDSNTNTYNYPPTQIFLNSTFTQPGGFCGLSVGAAPNITGSSGLTATMAVTASGSPNFEDYIFVILEVSGLVSSAPVIDTNSESVTKNPTVPVTLASSTLVSGQLVIGLAIQTPYTAPVVSNNYIWI